MLECAYEVREAAHAFLDGQAKDGEHVAHFDRATSKSKRVQVVDWFERSARVRFGGSSGNKLQGLKRLGAFDRIVPRRDLARVVPALSKTELDYIAQRGGIIGPPKARRKQERYELRQIRKVVPETALPKATSMRKCILQPCTIQWGA